jgi:hypothetical protein
MILSAVVSSHKNLTEQSALAYSTSVLAIRGLNWGLWLCFPLPVSMLEMSPFRKILQKVADDGTLPFEMYYNYNQLETGQL